MVQELWAVDLSLHYSDTLAMYRLLQFSTGGQLDPQTHYFNVPPAIKEERRSRRKKLKEEPEVKSWMTTVASLIFNNAITYCIVILYRVCVCISNKGSSPSFSDVHIISFVGEEILRPRY